MILGVQEFISMKKFFLFAILILFLSCSVDRKKQSPTPSQVSIRHHDRIWLEKFFQDFFFNEPTIYTLFGSKPMSEISLCTSSREEWIENYTNLWKNFPESKQKELLSQLEKHIENYDLPINWEKWINWSKNNLGGFFLFSKRKTDSDKLFSIYMLNVKEAAWILQKHYSIIKKEIVMDFDPLQVVLEFDNVNSIFWEKIFSSHFLQGILHGYGERNAYFFDREMRLQEINDFDLKTHPFFSSAGSKQDQDSNDFALPAFRSYSIEAQEDPILIKYKKEREKIRKCLRRKNFTDAILLQLGYRATPQKKEIAFTSRKINE